MQATIARQFHVNGVLVDLDAGCLTDASGRDVALRPKPFAVLRHLASNINRVVGKDELIDAVWPGNAVGDDSLVQCICDIRRALADTDRSVLRTVPRRGYRLVLPVQPTTAVPVGYEVADRPGRHIWPPALPSGMHWAFALWQRLRYRL
jgi:DNA-binding winged helix-turn-helix (wHTH) protein